MPKKEATPPLLFPTMMPKDVLTFFSTGKAPVTSYYKEEECRKQPKKKAETKCIIEREENEKDRT
jgi:hypothetical protein